MGNQILVPQPLPSVSVPVIDQDPPLSPPLRDRFDDHA